jgi:hypothetical protein
MRAGTPAARTHDGRLSMSTREIAEAERNEAIPTREARRRSIRDGFRV